MHNTLRAWAVAGCAALACVMLPRTLSGATFQLDSCDDSGDWGYVPQGGVTVSAAATHQEGTGAIHISIPASSSTYRTLRDLPVDKLGAFWKNYQGLRFWVKGDGSVDWGIVTVYEAANWYRYYATFPMTDGVWTEVTIPWREFYQNGWRGTLEDTLALTGPIGFERASSFAPAQPVWPRWPAAGFDVDDVRLVNGLVLPPTPIPANTSLDNVRAKLVAKQPVKVVVIGTSFEWGLQLADPLTQAYAPKLQALLRTEYDYADITVINQGLRGADSYEGGHNMGILVWNQEPADLLIVGGFYFNDSFDIYANDLALPYDTNNFQTVVVPGGPGQSVDNFDRIFRAIRRRGTMDVLFAPTALYAGNPTGLSNHVARIKAKAAALHIPVADVYGALSALDPVSLRATYFTTFVAPGYDTHPNAAWHTRIAEIIRDTIVNK